MSGRDLLAALVVVLIWGTNFVAMKIALRDLTPLQLGAGRYLFAILPLVLLVKPPKLHWKWVVMYGLFQGVGQFGLLFISLQMGMTAALASVVLQTQVFFTALFGFLTLGERVGRPLQIGLALAALGLACFGMNYLGAQAGAGASAGGFALCLAAAAMWAASNIVVRRAQRATPQFDVIAFMVWSSLLPIVPFILLSLAFDAPETRWRWLAAPWSTWASLAYLGWMATILGYALWTGLLKRHAVNRVAPFSLGVPLVGISAGMLVLGDVISGWQWAGIAMVVAALVCVLLGGRLMEKSA
ncbi:O-acetylserine/cysteine efflux transporter [Janthinobacterium sp. CG_23.3]|uniref:EamA family transporter n=1 Tax=unclassified Janthinobacterium TaxID=2610881 RepID=UPI000344E19A|nr:MULTISPECIES: EamA family transporter [unclassified Janthinobacterium]MEC5162477.1 O-acetylserine/cysteine efflux transporter [Janthinobacterium sp. CG_S6]